MKKCIEIAEKFVLRNIYMVASAPAVGKSYLLKRCLNHKVQIFYEDSEFLDFHFYEKKLAMSLNDRIDSNYTIHQSHIDNLISLKIDRSILMHVDIFSALHLCDDFDVGDIANMDTQSVASAYRSRFNPLVEMFDELLVVTLVCDFETVVERFKARLARRKWKASINGPKNNVENIFAFSKKPEIFRNDLRSNLNDIVYLNNHIDIYDKIYNAWTIYADDCSSYHKTIDTLDVPISI